MKKLFGIMAIALGMSSAAHAGLLVEPYLGYMFGDHKWKISGTSTEYTDSFGGAAYGLRLGYKFVLPWVALDYTGYSGKAKNGVPGGTDFDYSGSALGAVVGVDLPVMFRFWAGYGFQNNLTKKYSGADLKFTGGYTKVGVGFKGFPMVSINAEYIINKYDKVDGGSGVVNVDSAFSTYDANLMMLSVSMPFNL